MFWTRTRAGPPRLSRKAFQDLFEKAVSEGFVMIGDEKVPVHTTKGQRHLAELGLEAEGFSEMAIRAAVHDLRSKGRAKGRGVYRKPKEAKQ